uniref:RAB6-interacting golgin n=1 Tax=Ascaris lumbricoides TaxID=6252 RepID=A0A0M3I6F2_ASCLU
MAEERREAHRRRGVGGTLPVGWKHMSPPNEEVRHKILQQIMERVKKEEQASAERAARAEERKNEKEKSAWHRQQIEDCNKKIESVNCRKTELDDLKSRLFAELKEVVAKDKAQKATIPSLMFHLSEFCIQERHDSASGDNSATGVTASSSLSGHMQAQQMAHHHDGLIICKQFKMCGNALHTSEEPQINCDCDENIVNILSQYVGI